MTDKTVRVLPTEVELAIDLQPCLSERRTHERADRKHPCEFFADQGSFHSFDLKDGGPPATPTLQQPASYAGRRRVTPEMLSGCRKAPIMAVGINPNLPVFWSGKHNSILPVFDDVLQYAHHYRYRAIGKLQIPEAAYEELRAGRDDDAVTGPPLTDEGAQIPTELADQKMYLAYQSLLDGLATQMGWPGTLTVGEDLAYGNMVACASPRWITKPDPKFKSLPVMTTAQQRGIVEECFSERRYFLRQLFQSLPRVLLVFGTATRDAVARAMEGKFTEGAPKVGEDIETLLGRKIVLRYGATPSGQELTARVIFVPHASGNPEGFAAVSAKVVAALVEEANAGRLVRDNVSGHLRRPEGDCVFCDNALYKIGNCDYKGELRPLAGALEESGEDGATAAPAAVRERRVQEGLLDRFLAPGATIGVEESGEEEAAGSKAMPDRFVLIGRVVTMDDAYSVVPRGAVYVNGDTIEAVLPVGEAGPDGYAEAPRVDTGGTLYPGMIDLHNHLAYNVLPPWAVNKRYDDRSQWRRATAYSARTGLMKRLQNGNPAKAVARWVEVKALLGGATTLQGMRSSFKTVSGAFKGLVRNLESGGPGMASAGSGVIDLDPKKEDLVTRFKAASASKKSAYLYHLSEGINDAARQFWRDLVEHDLLGPALVGIHCLAVPAEGFDALKAADATVVWSPTSNLMLYGQTLDLKPLLASGVRWTIGCDWSPTGGKNPLFELKHAKAVAEAQGVDISSRTLVSAVTRRAARAVYWHKAVGQIVPGMKADLIAIAGTAGDPYDRLVAATERDVQLVMIGGVPRAGTAAMFDAARVPSKGREQAKVGDRQQQLWLADPGAPLDGFTLARAAEILQRRMTSEEEPADEESGEEFDPSTSIELDLDDEMAPILPPGGIEEAAAALPQPPDALTVVDDEALWKALTEIKHFPRRVDALRDYYR